MEREQKEFKRAIREITNPLIQRLNITRNKNSRVIIQGIIDTATRSLWVVLFRSPSDILLNKPLSKSEMYNYIKISSHAFLSYSYNCIIPNPGYENVFQNQWNRIITDFNNVLEVNVTKEIIDKYVGDIMLDSRDGYLNSQEQEMINLLNQNIIIGTELLEKVWGVIMKKESYQFNIHDLQNYNLLDQSIKQSVYLASNIFQAFSKLLAPKIAKIKYNI